LRRPRLEVAHIFRAHGEAYRHRHPLGDLERRVMHRIKTCRTAVLGGHVDVCHRCGHHAISYNSCRDRHCPKCQCLRQARWVTQRMERVLPTPHFHAVFTVPQELKPLALHNRVRFFEILFAAASRTLLALGHDPRRLGGLLGITAVLHTWSRTLDFHPHLHCIVTGGGLALDGRRWVAAPGRGRFLFPVKVMATLFRAKLLAALVRAHRRGELQFSGSCAHLADPAAFARLKDDLFGKPWVVYCKPPFGGARQVFHYLGRYTHRVGISNQRLIAIGPNGVTFATKNGEHTTLPPDEFIRRFLLHVLPAGFVKIRHYGLLAASRVHRQLAEARHLLEPARDTEPSSAQPVVTTWRDLFRDLTGVDLTRCRACGRGTVIRHPLPSAALDPPDTS
jgi:hypothetical protein